MLQKDGETRLFAFKTTQRGYSSASPPHLLRSGRFLYVCTDEFYHTPRSGFRPWAIVSLKSLIIMSKGSLFWGNARGRLGQSVFYRAGGEQRNRTYVAKIKNPRTRAQMKNRLSMSNFANIFRAYQPVLKESFIGRPVKESGFNAFMKANKNSSSAIILPEAKDAGLGVPLNMIVSQGTISNFGSYGSHQISLGSGASATNFIGFKLEASGAAAAQYNQEAMAALLNNGYKSIVDSTNEVNFLFQALGLPSDAVISILWGQYMDEGYQMGVNHYSLNSVSVTNDEFHLSLMSQPGTAFGVGVWLNSLQTDELICAVILSYKVNGKLNCTPARILSVGDDKTFSAEFMGGGELYNEVLSQYSTGSALVGEGSFTSVEKVTIMTSVNNNSMGTVEGAGTYLMGESVTLTAIPNSGYKFLSWGDGVQDNPRVVIADEDNIIYSAIFQAN